MDGQMTREQQNILARSILLQNSVRMVQQISSQTINPASQSVLNIQPRNVGLTLGFIVEVTAGLTNGATDTATLTPFGVSNLVSQFIYTDLNGVNRVQTTGYHIAMLDSSRQGFIYGGSYASNVPIGYGNNVAVMSGAATIAGAGTTTARCMYYVPLAYSANDLRGAVYTNVTNATQQLQISLNTDPFVGATDPLNAIYSGNNNGGYTSTVTVNVYQVYRDQIPFNNGVPVLPIDDLNTVYDLKNTNLSGMTANQDFAFAFPNMRQFLSVFAIYDNGGTFNAGTDINYFSLESANSTQLFKVTPRIAALFGRQTFMTDPPLGTYYFDFRDRPIDTITFGNMTLNMNAATVGANSMEIVLTEAFQQVNQIPYASSLSI